MSEENHDFFGGLIIEQHISIHVPMVVGENALNIFILDIHDQGIWMFPFLTNPQTIKSCMFDWCETYPKTYPERTPEICDMLRKAYPKHAPETYLRNISQRQTRTAGLIILRNTHICTYTLIHIYIWVSLHTFVTQGTAKESFCVKDCFQDHP